MSVVLVLVLLLSIVPAGTVLVASPLILPEGTGSVAPPDDYRSGIGSIIVTLSDAPLVAFMWNYTGAPDSGIYHTAAVNESGTIPAPTQPIRDGYKFYRWTSDAANEIAFYFSAPILANTELYAHWLDLNPAPPPVGSTPQEAAEFIVNQMTFEEMMAQVMFPRAPGQITNSAQTLETLGSGRINYGGATLFAADVAGTLNQIVALTHGLQVASIRGSRFNIPMMLSIDNESGQSMWYGGGSSTSFLGTTLIGMMGLGAVDEASVSYRAGEVLGREVLAGGINVNLAPCVDVNANPANPVIHVRSPGSCPLLASRVGSSVVRGMQSVDGVISVAKHFPGHGNTATDTHAAVLTMVPGNMDFLRVNDLAPFKAAVDAGVAAIMTAHVTVPQADVDADGNTMMMRTEQDTHATENRMVIPRIATFSPWFMTEVLRNEMGFTGLVITDGLEMAAIRRFYRPATAVYLTIMAGVDIPLIPLQGSGATFNGTQYPNMIEELKAFAEGRATVTGNDGAPFDIDGPAFMARVKESTARLIATKIKFGVYDPWAGENQPPVRRSLAEAQEYARQTVRHPEHLAVEQEASDKAISLAVNERINGRRVLPFAMKDGDSVYILTSSNAEGRRLTLQAAVQYLANRDGLNITVTSSTYPDTANGITQAHRDAIAAADHVIIGSLINSAATRLPSNNRSRNVIAIWDFIRANGYDSKSVNVSLGIPYELGYLRNASAVVNINTRIHSNIAHDNRLTQLNSAVTGVFSAPLYLSAIRVVFGDLTPTGTYPVDVWDEWSANPAGNLIRRVGDGMTFYPPITSLRITTAQGAPAAAMITVPRNSELQFDVAINEGSSKEEFTWSVSNPAFASVSESGLVTIKNLAGTAILTAKADSGVTHSVIFRII